MASSRKRSGLAIMRCGRASASIAAVAWLLTTAVTAQAAPPLSEVQKGRIEALFGAWDDLASPGAAIAVVRGGELVFADGYGSAQLEYGVPITPRTVFHVASVSKQFTDYLVLLLERDGLLGLDDDVRRHVPEVPDFGRTITLRHLANHTSGLRDQWELLAMAGWRLDDVITKEQILRMVARQRDLNFEPGAEYLYCNTGYTLLAETAARASGKSFRELAGERIFGPLGMTRSHMHDDHEHIVPGRAYSYARQGDGFKKSVLSYANAGATSLFTTAEDLARWLVHLQEKSAAKGSPEAALLERGRLSNGEQIDYAVGLMHSVYRGVEVVGHGGADAGFRSWIGWFPDRDLGIAVLSNVATFDAAGKAMAAAEIVLGDAFEPLPEGARPAEGDEPVELAAEQLDRAVGAYLLDIGSILQVRRRGGQLIGEAPSTEPVALEPRSETRFWIEALEATVEFSGADDAPFARVLVQMPTARVEGERVEPMDAQALDGLLGRYWSPELDTAYEIVRDGDGLVARHQRHDDIQLLPTTVDVLVGDQWWFGKAEFERSGGEVSGFRLTGGRVRNVLFERQ